MTWSRTHGVRTGRSEKLLSSGLATSLLQPFRAHHVTLDISHTVGHTKPYTKLRKRKAYLSTLVLRLDEDDFAQFVCLQQAMETQVFTAFPIYQELQTGSNRVPFKWEKAERVLKGTRRARACLSFRRLGEQTDPVGGRAGAVLT